MILSTVFCADVSAHGDPPAGTEIYEVDGQWIYVTNFGVITDAWPREYVCEEAFFGTDDFFVAPLDRQQWVTFTPATIATTERACNFESSHSLSQLPRDIAVEADAEQIAYIVRENEAVTLAYSDDGGRHFEPVDVVLDDIVPSGIDFLEPGRLVVVGYEADDDRRGISVVSQIDPVEATRHDRDTDDELMHPELLDARDGEVLWHGGRDGEREIFWERLDEHTDGFLSPRWPTSGAIAPKAEAAYVGGLDENGRGVYRATSDARAIWTEIIAGHRALCMTVGDGGDLLVCGHRRDDDHDLARWSDDDGLVELVDFRNLEGYRSDCDDTAQVPNHCRGVWPDIATALDIDIDDADDDPGDSEPDEKGGCQTTGAPFPFALIVAGWWMGFGLRMVTVRRCTARGSDRKARSR